MSAPDNIRRLGFGCSGPWGERWFSKKRALDLLLEAMALGVRHFDSGSFYGDGEAERRLGRGLKEAALPRDQITLSSKTGTVRRGGQLVKDFSPDQMQRDVETSLERLGTDYLDILYLHGPSDDQLKQALPLLQKQQQDGLIRAIGVCTTPPHVSKALETEGVKVIMARYNLLDRAFAAHFKAIKNRGQKIVTIAPLAQGLYRRGFFWPHSPTNVWYLARALVKNRTQLARARRLQKLSLPANWSLPAAMLAWSLHPKEINTGLINTTKIAHLRTNIAAAQQVLPDSLRQQMDRLALDLEASNP